MGRPPWIPPERSRVPRLGKVIRVLTGALVVLTVGLGTVLATIRSRPVPPRPPSPASGAVRIVTYNIRAGLGGLDRVIEDLRPLAADVIALQEIERGVARSLRVDQVAAIAGELGFQAVFRPSIASEVNGDHGLAVLSRFPLTDVQTLELPQGNGKWPRIALGVRVEDPAGPFRLVTVHLARPWGWPYHNTTTRLGQLNVVKRAWQNEPLPLVLCGDFNSFAWSLEAWRLGPQLRHAWEPWRDGSAPSWSLMTVGWPGGAVKIDHVFRDDHWSCDGTWAAPPGASDHRPVVADLRRKS
jgi:endonuclease/exonuclease/phosphatase family metal-dependent hydrolase